MGKSKKRIFNKNKIVETSIRREDAVRSVLKSIKGNLLDVETKNLISLFGISAEELAESGASYEELRALKNLI